jgi:hypothetical protein
MAIPASCTHCTTSPESSFTTDATGQMGCGTELWVNAQANTSPAYFDIVIDVNDNNIYDEGIDFLDAASVAGFAIDTDGDGDGVLNVEDNCWEVSNPYQIDSNHDCPAPPYTVDPECGDDCEVANTCLADIAPITGVDCKVNLSDLVLMKGEFLRPDCATTPCYADIAPAPNGDNKVNLSDLVLMKGEFLRPDCCQ